MPDRSDPLGDTGFTVRRAALSDVTAIVELLRDDVLGRKRESADLADYERPFREIDSDPRHFLAVVQDADGRVVGTMQLTLLPGLSRGGATRLQIEAVRVAADIRGSGLGEQMLLWAEEHGKQAGATLVQLTTDKSRTGAHRFYDRLGYAASHEGYKKELEVIRP